MAEIDNFSRFQQTEQIIFKGKETFGVWSNYSWLQKRPPDDQISTFYVDSSTEGRPDIIASQIYGSPLLDWVIIAFNAKISNDNTALSALVWPKAGQVVEYPRESLIMSSLLN